MKRIAELDLVKCFIILVSMIAIHTMYDLADLEPSIQTEILNILATAWGAPVFMFCMGVTLGLSRHQEASDWFRRGFHLITIGMVLNVLRYGPMSFTSFATDDTEKIKGLAMIFNDDILQFAGLAFIFLALCKKMRIGPWTILILSVIMSVAGTLLTGHNTSSYVLNQLLGYFYHTPTCSCFPLLNWFIFVAAGNIMGMMYKVKYYYRFIIPICGIVAITHQYLSITGQSELFKTLLSDWEFYGMPTIDALCIALGVAPFMLGIFKIFSLIIPEKWIPVLEYPSRNITQYYCISWVWIMWISCFLYFIEPAHSFAGFALRWIGIVALTTITSIVYNRYLKEKILPCFSRHKVFWYTATWVFVICFGIWYFNNIPEPYIMPY